MNEAIKGWLGFIVVLIVRGSIMFFAGWAVLLVVEEVWRSSVVFSLVLWLLLTFVMGFLYTMIEGWP